MQFVLILLVIRLSSAALSAAEVIDGVVATVNGVAILQSDIDQAGRCEILLEGRPLAALTPEFQRSVLERLIDQELLRQQMGNAFPPPTSDELAVRIREVRAQWPGAKADRDWGTLLARYGVSEAEVAERISVQVQVTRFLEPRLHSKVQVDAASVEAYYREKLLPELRKRGVQSDPPLAEVSGQIEEILRQERMDDMLVSWLHNLRQQNRIEVRLSLEPPAAASPERAPRPAGETASK